MRDRPWIGPQKDQENSENSSNSCIYNIRFPSSTTYPGKLIAPMEVHFGDAKRGQSCEPSFVCPEPGLHARFQNANQDWDHRRVRFRLVQVVLAVDMEFREVLSESSFDWS